MIDLILWGATKADFRQFALDNGLVTLDDEGNPKLREGFEYSWWAGSGKLMTQRGEYDAEGNEITPPSFLNGFVALCRIHGKFFNSDRLETAEENPEQWQRSKVARYVKNNGTPGSVGGITYYKIGNVRLFRAKDVFDWLASRDLPGHEWLGGNSV